jgi:hypothetical protein
MNKVNPLIYFLLGLMSLASTSTSVSMHRPCADINVTIEVISDAQQSNDSVKILFGDNGNYKIQVLDSRGNITVYKNTVISNLRAGEYDLIITDQADSNRCPFYKRIKIGGR